MPKDTIIYTTHQDFGDFSQSVLCLKHQLWEQNYPDSQFLTRIYKPQKIAVNDDNNNQIGQRFEKATSAYHYTIAYDSLNNPIGISILEEFLQPEHVPMLTFKSGSLRTQPKIDRVLNSFFVLEGRIGVYVKPEWRGCKIATKLLQQTEPIFYNQQHLSTGTPMLLAENAAHPMCKKLQYAYVMHPPNCTAGLWDIHQMTSFYEENQQRLTLKKWPKTTYPNITQPEIGTDVIHTLNKRYRSIKLYLHPNFDIILGSPTRQNHLSGWRPIKT